MAPDDGAPQGFWDVLKQRAIGILNGAVGDGGSKTGPFGSLSRTTFAQPMSAYPSTEDAVNARSVGAGYGNPYMDSSRDFGRVMGTAIGKQRTFVPQSAVGRSLKEATGAVDNGSANFSPAPPDVSDAIQRAAIAANRIPIAALGFDPSRMVADTKTQGSNVNIAGGYDPQSDAIYYNMDQSRAPSTPVHESIHRGLNMLRQDPANAEAFKNLPNEEYVVRYLMAKQAGDPELGTGKTADAQRDLGLSAFSGPFSKDRLKALDDLTAAAQKAIAARRQGGPR